MSRSGKRFFSAAVCPGFDAAAPKRNQKKDVQPENINGKVVFPDLSNPPKGLTPLTGEVAKSRTLTESHEQKSHKGDKFERCLPENTEQSACPRR